MALNSSGPISIGGSTTGQSINLELNLSATATSSLNDSALRTLAGIASGQISLSNFYGKSNYLGNAYFVNTDSTGSSTGMNSYVMKILKTFPTSTGTEILALVYYSIASYQYPPPPSNNTLKLVRIDDSGNKVYERSIRIGESAQNCTLLDAVADTQTGTSEKVHMFFQDNGTALGYQANTLRLVTFDPSDNTISAPGYAGSPNNISHQILGASATPYNATRYRLYSNSNYVIATHARSMTPGPGTSNTMTLIMCKKSTSQTIVSNLIFPVFLDGGSQWTYQDDFYDSQLDYLDDVDNVLYITNSTREQVKIGIDYLFNYPSLPPPTYYLYTKPYVGNYTDNPTTKTREPVIFETDASNIYYLVTFSVGSVYWQAGIIMAVNKLTNVQSVISLVYSGNIVTSTYYDTPLVYIKNKRAFLHWTIPNAFQTANQQYGDFTYGTGVRACMVNFSSDYTSITNTKLLDIYQTGADVNVQHTRTVIDPFMGGMGGWSGETPNTGYPYPSTKSFINLIRLRNWSGYDVVRSMTIKYPTEMYNYTKSVSVTYNLTYNTTNTATMNFVSSDGSPIIRGLLLPAGTGTNLTSSTPFEPAKNNDSFPISSAYTYTSFSIDTTNDVVFPTKVQL